mgnify:CR=1 FL=1
MDIASHRAPCGANCTHTVQTTYSPTLEAALIVANYLRIVIMKLFNEFLEISSIHGLYHIYSNTHFARVFWVCTVIIGFSFAAAIINLSFVSWNKSPISTLIETKPIEELKFPNVTVCPPQDTYTTLNYDLQKLEGIEMDDATRNELYDLLFRLYHELHVNDTMENLEFLIEENRFQNWYKGITKVTVPPPMNLMESWNETQFNINTSFSSGSIQTIGFRQPFEAANFVHNLNLNIKIVFEYNLDANGITVISSKQSAKLIKLEYLTFI